MKAKKEEPVVIPKEEPVVVPLPRPEPVFGHDGNSDLRDKFAMAALTGLVMNGRWLLDAPKRAYELADEMMKERSRGN